MITLKKAINKIIKWAQHTEIKQLPLSTSTNSTPQKSDTELNNLQKSIDKITQKLLTSDYSQYNNTPIFGTSHNPYSSIGALTTQQLSAFTTQTSPLTAMINLNHTHGVTVNKQCNLSFKLFSANGGFVAEVTTHTNNEDPFGYTSSKPSLHILRHEDLGKQLEKIIAIELLRT